MKQMLDIDINTKYNTFTPMKHTLIKLLGIIAILWVFTWVTGNAIDRHFDQQDRMLCHSAQVSGNAEYLEKCVCYYNGEAVSCIHRDSENKSTDAGSKEVTK